MSLALLGGLMLHDMAGARMSFDMAAAAATDQSDEVCPACEVEDVETVACDLDCTAPLLFTGALSATMPERLTAGTHLPTAPDAFRARRPGFDPAPPRTTILS
jgi:hypothetical protein